MSTLGIINCFRKEPTTKAQEALTPANNKVQSEVEVSGLAAGLVATAIAVRKNVPSEYLGREMLMFLGVVETIAYAPQFFQLYRAIIERRMCKDSLDEDSDDR